MDKHKKKQLQKNGWHFGSVGEFLNLTPSESEYIELRLNLAACLKRKRLNSGLSQTTLAKQTGSSQSRIAKMEAGDPSVSIDLLIRALLTLGATRDELAVAIKAA
jgi:ribosome-binding protein aMBF1 (putative translation factor)